MRRSRLCRRAQGDSSIEPHLLSSIFLSFLSLHGMAVLITPGALGNVVVASILAIVDDDFNGRPRFCPHNMASRESTAVPDHRPFVRLYGPGDLQGGVGFMLVGSPYSPPP